MKKIYRGFQILEGAAPVSTAKKELVYRGIKHVVDPALVSYPDRQMKKGVYRGVPWAA